MFGCSSFLIMSPIVRIDPFYYVRYKKPLKQGTPLFPVEGTRGSFVMCEFKSSEKVCDLILSALPKILGKPGQCQMKKFVIWQTEVKRS